MSRLVDSLPRSSSDDELAVAALAGSLSVERHIAIVAVSAGVSVMMVFLL